MTTAPIKPEQSAEYNGVKITSPKAIVDVVAQEAQSMWGKHWFANLVRAYCEIEGIMTGEQPAAHLRRSTIERGIKTGRSIWTAIWLAAAVGAELQMAVYHVEIRKF
jgi:hypothetical protein